jgi:hypothetical protein
MDERKYDLGVLISLLLAALRLHGEVAMLILSIQIGHAAVSVSSSGVHLGVVGVGFAQELWTGSHIVFRMGRAQKGESEMPSVELVSQAQQPRGRHVALRQDGFVDPQLQRLDGAA